jgi:very-short-patch-repair endonuclease
LRREPLIRRTFGAPPSPARREGVRAEKYEGIMTTHHRLISPAAQSRARALRVQQTDAERALWRLLRDRRLQSTKWRRQVPIGIYIADFACFEYRLIVECDGAQHADSLRDMSRDDWLRAQGFAIARFWNHEILHERENVLNTILARCGLPW